MDIRPAAEVVDMLNKKGVNITKFFYDRDNNVISLRSDLYPFCGEPFKKFEANQPASKFRLQVKNWIKANIELKIEELKEECDTLNEQIFKLKNIEI